MAIGSTVVMYGPRRARRWGAVLGVTAALVPLTGVAQPATAYSAHAVGPTGTAVATAATSSSPPRDQTLYTSGTSSYPPTNFNPLDPASYTGSQGLLYEPLFLYDPIHGDLVPWLATSGTWATSTTYQLEVRSGVDWVSSRDGSVAGTLDAADVAYSIKLAMTDPDDPYHPDVASARSVMVTGHGVTVTFAQPVGYAQWQEFLWHAPVLPEMVWSRFPSDRQVSEANTAPVSTGPMLLDSFNPTEACYRDNPRWWGTAQLKLSFKFGYLCDLVSSSSGTELSSLLDDRIDWSNQLLRGITNLANGYGIKTYYPAQPYMLPASTAWLQLNVAQSPMNDLDFRRAVAYALEPAAIVSSVYTGTVQVANPTGLLPELGSFVNSNVVKKYGFFYSPSLSRHNLAESGYKGQLLELIVPEGWTDLVDAADAMAAQLGKVGIHVSVRQVPLQTRDADVASGNYQMVINVGATLGSTPWSYFDTVYQLPLAKVQTGGQNTERFSAPADWSLVQEAAATPLTDTTALDGIYANLEQDFLQQLPEIPLWYSGAWFQANTGYWANYPTSTNRDDNYTPVMWAGWLGATTTVLALAQLKPAPHSH